MRVAYLILAMLAAVSTAAAAQQQGGFSWKTGDKDAPPNPAQASKNGFGAMMLVTDDYDGFWKAWEGPTPPQVRTTERVTRGKPVHGMLLFSGCRAGSDGNCDVDAEFSTTAPDGSAYGEMMKGKVWTRPRAPGYNLQLSEGSLGFILEPDDPLGVYTLKATVTDKVAGTTVFVRQSITAVAMPLK